MTQEVITEQQAVDNFVASVANNNMDEFKEDLAYMLNNNFNINLTDVDGDTALCLAILEGHNDIIALLLKQDGIDVNAKDGEGDAPIHYACMSNKVDALKLLLARDDIDVNIKNDDEDLSAAEMSIAMDDRKYIAKVILADKRVDVNALTSNGITLLILAILLERHAITKALINNSNIDVNLEVDPSTGLAGEGISNTRVLLEDIIEDSGNPDVKVIENSNPIENEAVAGTSNALGMAIVMGEPKLLETVLSHPEIEVTELSHAAAQFFGNQEIIDLLKQHDKH